MGLQGPFKALGVLGYVPIVQPFGSSTLNAMAGEFSAGFAEGLAGRLSPSVGRIAAAKIRSDPVGFYTAYLGGFVTGLVSGLKSLLGALVSVARLAEAVSVPGLVRTSLKESWLLLTSESHRDLRRLQVAQAKRLALAVAGLIREIEARPAIYVDKSRYVGVVLGQELAAYITDQALSDSASELGAVIGRVVGQVAFEIIVAILLLLVSGGAGNVLRGIRIFGQAGEGASAYARLIARLGDVLEGIPALRRLIIEGLEGLAATSETVVGRDVFQIARQVVARSDLNALQKANLLESIFSEITAADASWSASRGPAFGAEAMFTGETRPFGLIVDKQGVVWTTKDVDAAGGIARVDGKLQYVPDLTKWVQVR